MIPVSLSASSIHVADLCLGRWEAEYFGRSRSGSSNDAASLGNVVHSALEDFVADVYIHKVKQASLNLLLSMYHVYFIAHFVTDTHEFYQDGVEMLTRWFERTPFEDVTVLSVESKNYFELPTSVGPIRFNYIFDRMDQLGEREFKVVDYKTIRWGYSPEDLHKKVQPRVYALAAAIQLKAQGIIADKIRIEFDLLRHDRIGTVFTRKDNLDTWGSLIRIAEQIIAAPEGRAPRSLNGECNFCPLKSTCPELRKSINYGGAPGRETVDLVDIRAQLDWQRRGLEAALNELDTLLLTRARTEDVLTYETETNRMKVHVGSRRYVDPDMVEMAVGTDKFMEYGGKSLTMGGFDSLLKDKGVDADVKRVLKSLVNYKKTDPKIVVESRGFAPE